MTVLSLQGRTYARSLHMSPRFGVLYLNNPKVACSSIKLTLQRAELDAPDYQPETSVHDHAASPLLTFPQIDVCAALVDAKFIFSFVRNPFDRLISAYVNKIVVPQNGGRLREHAGFRKDQCPSFEDFVLAICAQDPADMNPHWRVQALNLSVGVVPYDFIGRLENLASDWAQVSAKTGLPETLSFAGVRTADWTRVKPTYTARATQAVQSAFHVDFETFGYKKTPPPP